VQERGVRRRRPTPYDLDARLGTAGSAGTLTFVNRSRERAAVFHVYDVARLEEAPARYTVAAGGTLDHALAGARDDLFVVGPDGFHRRLTGRSDIFSAGITGARGAAPVLEIRNLTPAALSIAMTDRAYGAAPAGIAMAPHETRRIPLDLRSSHGWYDRQFAAGGQTWRIAGKIEDGRPSFSDPAAGGPAPLHLDPAI
jgi:phospholipase C